MINKIKEQMFDGANVLKQCVMYSLTTRLYYTLNEWFPMGQSYSFYVQSLVTRLVRLPLMANGVDPEVIKLIADIILVGFGIR